MNRGILAATFGLVVLLSLAGCGDQPGEPVVVPPTPTPTPGVDHRADLRSALQVLSNESSDALLRLHFLSMLSVLEAGDRQVPADTDSINQLWQTFEDGSAADSPRQREAYLNRSQQLIISWTSPADGQVSFAWLRLPAGWDPEKEYPLYVQLHGYWDVADSRVAYLAYPFLHPSTSAAFEDGYLVSPWGRGNLWYRGLAEADFWECMGVIESLVRIDKSRKYLCGHSMGGYGVWHIALTSADTWAAIGVHAGALWYDESELTVGMATLLRAVPTYFVVGTYDSLLLVNQTAYLLLWNLGNPYVDFVTFSGGHECRQEDVERMYQWMREFRCDACAAAEGGRTDGLRIGPSAVSSAATTQGAG